MTARTTLKIDTSNPGGIAKEFRKGVDFYIVYQQNGETVAFTHNDAGEPVPSLLKRLGLTHDETVLCERIR